VRTPPLNPNEHPADGDRRHIAEILGRSSATRDVKRSGNIVKPITRSPITRSGRRSLMSYGEHQDRRNLFDTRFGHPMKPQSTFEEQVDFITFEMRNSARKSWSRAAATTTPSDAADKVCRLYERPQNPDKDSQIRMGLAEAYARSLA
jgi:Phage tail lysozyme